MKRVVSEIGIGKVLRYAFGQLQIALLKGNLVLPPFRTFFLRLFGASVGRESIVHPCTFFNVYRKGFRGLKLGQRVFVGNECLLDLADSIRLDASVTLAERVTILTHVNVGYLDHPLQSALHAMQAPVHIGEGSFIGTNVTILPGVVIGKRVIVGAGSLVRENIPDEQVAAGVPARIIRSINE